MPAGQPLDQQIEALTEKQLKERLADIEKSGIVIPLIAIEAVSSAIRTSFLSGGMIVTSCLIRYDGGLTPQQFQKALKKVGDDYGLGTKRAGD